MIFYKLKRKLEYMRL